MAEENAMAQLEQWAFYEELENEAYQIMGQLFIHWPTSMATLIQKAARLHEILTIFGGANDPGNRHSIWGCAEQFLFLFAFQKHMEESESPFGPDLRGFE